MSFTIPMPIAQCCNCKKIFIDGEYAQKDFCECLSDYDYLVEEVTLTGEWYKGCISRDWYQPDDEAGFTELLYEAKHNKHVPDHLHDFIEEAVDKCHDDIQDYIIRTEGLVAIR